MRKHLSLILVFVTFLLISCDKKNKQEPIESTVHTRDSMLLDIFNAVASDSVTLFDVSNEIRAVIDTMQTHAESYPDKDIRIGARSLAGILSQVFLDSTLNTPEEVAFALDSFVVPLAEITSTWYYGEDVYDTISFKFLSQSLIKYEASDNEYHISFLDLFFSDSLNRLSLRLPDDPVFFGSIAFGKELQDYDAATFYREDALEISEEEGTAEALVFGEEVIDEMQKNKIMYLNYFDIDTTKTLDERFHSCMLLLDKFQEQYNKYINK